MATEKSCWLLKKVPVASWLLKKISRLALNLPVSHPFTHLLVYLSIHPSIHHQYHAGVGCKTLPNQSRILQPSPFSAAGDAAAAPPAAHPLYRSQPVTYIGWAVSILCLHSPQSSQLYPWITFLLMVVSEKFKKFWNQHQQKNQKISCNSNNKNTAIRGWWIFETA